ncbi:uracil-DNA glycosylase [Candidatus Kirkpatrickella diaphorinae]|uniref:Uracil-DNA glycosylase n=1 Tax=Candidatus Kirkpatrickella diaphorinae TaxID=2984322 RepID=A0ABY6GGX5_9PROT|nr:uracil-DNA glycosylase [Candidatus Kirkpatrickella diaphorinae]UYH50756.1 uracil-DNA glycosylase [Candidatus Kirkpatrickella diaphorinae]
MSQNDHDTAPHLAAALPPPSPEAIRALLDFYKNWGVTCWLQDEPVAQPPLAAAILGSPSPPNEPPATITPTPATDRTSRPEPAISTSATTRHETPTSRGGRTAPPSDETRHPVLAGLARTAMTVVTPLIVPSASLLVIGEVPNADEDRSGIVFSGKTGEILDKMLASINLSRAEISLAPALPWRPPGGRHLNPAEMGPARAELQALIDQICPRQIVTMGTTPLQLVRAESTPLTSVRGKWMDIDILGRTYALLPMRHPLQILTSSRARQDFWRDLLTLVDSRK